MCVCVIKYVFKHLVTANNKAREGEKNENAMRTISWGLGMNGRSVNKANLS